MPEPARISIVKVVAAAALAVGGVGLAYVLLESFRTKAAWVNNVPVALTAALIAPMAIFVGVALFFRAIPPRRRSRDKGAAARPTDDSGRDG